MRPKKIDVFFRGKYQHSTIFYRTCKDAKNAAIKTWSKLLENNSSGYSDTMLARFDLMVRNEKEVKAYFDHTYLK